jgi:hypothetical protein
MKRLTTLSVSGDPDNPKFASLVRRLGKMASRSCSSAMAAISLEHAEKQE